jgi:hypothetical protein
MKSERRHELQHNELADWLFTTGQQLKPYQNMILAGVAVAVVAVAAYSWWSRTSAARASQAWTELTRGMETRSPELLTSMVEDYPNTVVGETAAAVLGDWHLAAGCNQRFVSMALAQDALNHAIDSYQKVLDKSESASLLERATYGMARAKETQGDLEGATQKYNDLVGKWPDGAYAAAAKQRLEDFKLLDTKLMFGDLRKFEPKPSFTDEPSALGPQPSFNEPLPAEPPVAPLGPSKTDVNKKSDGTKTEAEPKKK